MLHIIQDFRKNKVLLKMNKTALPSQSMPLGKEVTFASNCCNASVTVVVVVQLEHQFILQVDLSISDLQNMDFYQPQQTVLNVSGQRLVSLSVLSV